MKKPLFILFLLLVSLQVTLSAKTHLFRAYDDYHYFTVSLSGGYTTLLNDNINIKTLGGGGTALGVGYELRYGNFWLATGFETQYLSSSLRLTADNFSYLATDTEGDQISYHYNLDTYRDWQHGIYLNAPLMMGYISPQGIYFGLGTKAGGSVYGNTYTKVNYTTSATYGRYIEDFHDMPNHYYTTYHSRSDDKLKFQPSVSILAELGYDLFKLLTDHSTSINSGLKISLFAECGVLSVINNEIDKTLMWVESTNVSQLNVVPFYTANATTDYRILPLYVGIKATFLIGLPKKNCFNCNWYNEIEQ